jgi:hypothetical protein
MEASAMNSNRKPDQQYLINLYTEDGFNHYELTDLEGGQLDRNQVKQLLIEMSKSNTPPTALYVGYNAEGLFKIGITGDLFRRASELQITISTYREFPNAPEARYIERELHEIFTLNDQHSHGEWFYLESSDAEWLRKLCNMTHRELIEVISKRKAWLSRIALVKAYMNFIFDTLEETPMEELDPSIRQEIEHKATELRKFFIELRDELNKQEAEIERRLER